MKMELSFFNIFSVFVIIFFVIIYFKSLLCTKVLDFESLSNFCIQNF
jgi:hypothetical protein